MPTQIRHRDKLLGYRGILKWKDEYGQTRRRQKVFRLEKPVQLTPGGKPRGKAARKKANELWQKAAAWEDEQRVRRLRHTRGPVTLKALCEGYLDWVKAEQMTDRVVKEKERTIVQVLGFCKGTTAVDEIPVPMVHRLLRAEAERVSNNASNKLRRNLSAMWNWGRLYLDLETNPVAKVAKLPHTREPRRVPTRREVERLVAQARAEYQGLSDMADYLRKRQDYIMLVAYLNTGARRDELFRLAWEDVDWTRSQIRLCTRKRRSRDLEGDWIPPHLGAERRTLLLAGKVSRPQPVRVRVPTGQRRHLRPTLSGQTQLHQVTVQTSQSRPTLQLSRAASPRGQSPRLPGCAYAFHQQDSAPQQREHDGEVPARTGGRDA